MLAEGPQRRPSPLNRLSPLRTPSKQNVSRSIKGAAVKPVPSIMAVALASLVLVACAATGGGGSASSTGTPQAAAASQANPKSPSSLPTNQSTPGTQVACDMLLHNPVIGQLANTSAPLRVLAKAETSPNIYECQVGLHLTPTFTHGAEGGIYCNYGDPQNLTAPGTKPLASSIYRTVLPRTFLIIIGPHTAAGITVFLPGPPRLPLVIKALQAAALIVRSEGCP